MTVVHTTKNDPPWRIMFGDDWFRTVQGTSRNCDRIVIMAVSGLVAYSATGRSTSGDAVSMQATAAWMQRRPVRLASLDRPRCPTVNDLRNGKGVETMLYAFKRFGFDVQAILKDNGGVQLPDWMQKLWDAVAHWSELGLPTVMRNGLYDISHGLREYDHTRANGMTLAGFFCIQHGFTWPTIVDLLNAPDGAVLKVHRDEWQAYGLEGEKSLRGAPDVLIVNKLMPTQWIDINLKD